MATALTTSPTSPRLGSMISSRVSLIIGLCIRTKSKYLSIIVNILEFAHLHRARAAGEASVAAAGPDQAALRTVAAVAPPSDGREEDRVGQLVQEAAHHRERVEEPGSLQLAKYLG